MQSDLIANAEVTVPDSHNVHVTANAEFVRRFNPSASRVDKLLLKNILSDEALKPVQTTIPSISGINESSINADLLS
jgi:hypothetical protein